MINAIKVFRNLHLKRTVYPRLFSSQPDIKKENVKEESPSVEDVMRGPVYYPTNFDKRIFVFAGKYKKIEDVPRTVTPAAIDKARNKARIKVSNYMMLATAIACIGVAISGRRAAERGESVHKMNLDWHEEMNKK